MIGESAKTRRDSLWNIKIWYFFGILNLCSSFSILIVQNDENKENQIWFQEIKKQFEPVIDWHQCNYSAISECINIHSDDLIIFDLSDDFESQLSVSQICKENKKIHLVAQKKYKFQYSDDWSYSITPLHSTQMDAYFSALAYFNWTQGLVITDEDNIYAKQKFFNYSNNFSYLTIESSASIERIVSRIIKPLGATLYYIFTKNTISLKIQEALKSKQLLLSEDGIVLDQKSGYGCTIDGAIIITLAGQEYASSQWDFLSNSTQNLLQYLLNSTTEPTTVKELKYLLNIYNEKNRFSIVNINKSKREIVGSISDKTVSIFKQIIFPGNSFDIPKSDKKILHVTASGGAYNPGSPPLTVIPFFFYGALAAWGLINDGSLGILKNFQIKHFTFDCGANVYEESFTRACFTKDIDKFGLAHISAGTPFMAWAEVKLFESLNLTMPTVEALPIDNSLSSTADYPIFINIAMSGRYTIVWSLLLFKALGWSKVCVLYHNNSEWRPIYSLFISSAKQNGLEILNPENSRGFLSEPTRSNIKQLSEPLQTIIDTHARLLVLFFPPPQVYYIFEELYDMGLRKGDLFIFVVVPAYLELVQYDFMYTYKIKEAGVPMMVIDGQSWVGEIGEFAYSKIASLYNTAPLAYACLYYDAAYFIAAALDYMINQGLDYYDPYQRNSTLRLQKLTGCSGKISIEKNSNDRIMETFDVILTKIDTISGNLTVYKMGEFRPYSAAMLTVKSPIIYGDGTTTKPDDLRDQGYDCPFPKKLERVFIKGRVLVFGICFGFVLLSIVQTAYIWKKWWNIKVEELKSRHEISIEDFIVELTIGIEFFQFLAMGPDIAPFSSFLARISNSFSLNLENILKLENGVFWIAIDIVFGAIILWVILCLIILLRLDEKFPRISIFRFLAWLADYLMPILGNLCFIPFISMCLNVFVCDHSIGENFTDSYLSQDCYYLCWKDDHLVYAIFSLIALLCYEPLAVFCRPLWQELQNNVHIHTAPLFLMVKTVVQIIFIVMNKTVKRAESTIHGALFAILMTAYIGFIFRWKPYNYPRLYWWQALSLIGVLWFSVLSTISSIAKGDSFIYFLFMCIGWIVIVIVGICVQRKRYPILLYRKKGRDTTHLFKFAFTFGKPSKIALSKIAPSRRQSEDPISKDLYL